MLMHVLNWKLRNGKANAIVKLERNNGTRRISHNTTHKESGIVCGNRKVGMIY